MQKLKLTELLLSLDPAELKRLADFISSPFFNKNKKLISAFEFIENIITGSSIDNLTKEKLWQHISPGEKFSDLKIRSHLSDLKKLVERFIIVNEDEKHTLQQKNILLNSLSLRNSRKNFEVTSKEIGNILTNDFTKNFDHYLNKINFEKSLILNEGKNVEVNLDEHYYSLSDSIDHYFLSSKLDLMNSFLSRKYHVLGSFEFEMSFSDEIISFIERNLNEFMRLDPFIYTEYLIFKMMTAGDNDKYFSDLQAFVLKNLSKYDQHSLEQVYFPMINFGFNKVAMGENEYLEKLFDIYRSFERKRFYSYMEVFQDMDLISIVIAGLRLNKISWVENFMSKYSQKLTGEFRFDTEYLIKALISYEKKDYTSATEFLNKVNYQNSYYYLKSKETLMQIYYEQKEYESLQSLLDSTRHYLKRRRDVLSIHYDRYFMFLKYVGMLLKAVYDDKSKLMVLKRELKKNKNVIAREWLLEKVSERT